MRKAKAKSIVLVISSFVVLFLNSCLHCDGLSVASSEGIGAQNQVAGDSIISQEYLDGIWVDSFVTVHVNDLTEQWGNEGRETLEVAHTSTLIFDEGKFSLNVTPRYVMQWPGFASPYDTVSLELEGTFDIVGDTLKLQFIDGSDSPPEVFDYKLHGDSLWIRFRNSGSEVSPGLWEVKDFTYIWDGGLNNSEGFFRKSKSTK